MKKSITFLSIVGSLCFTNIAQADAIPIETEGDYGSHARYPASNATDKNTAFSSRWASNIDDGGGSANLFLDFGEIVPVNEIGIAWGRGDSRTYNFEVRARAETSGSWEKIRSRADSSGDTADIEIYDVDDIAARQVRIKIFSNSANTSWADVTEFEAYSSDTLITETPVEETPEETPIEETPIEKTPVEEIEITYTPPEVTGDTYTATVDSLDDVMELVSGGDEIIVTGSGEISLKNYDFNSPVLIRAESIGGTIIDNATIDNSNNITLLGFTFGPNEESTLLKIVNSTNIMVLRNLFDHEDITENQTSIVMTQASQYISIGYNEFRDKNIGDHNGEKITGSFIKTQFDDPQMTRNLHIFRNHFNNIVPYLDGDSPAGDSDREAIAMGIADSQDVITNNLVEYNLFENCDGENEIITVKTSNNVFRYNTFKNSMGSLSLRLGSNNEVYGNYFFGEGSGNSVTDNNYQTGGIRVYGSGHSIYENYMEDLTGISWRRPILIDSGDTSDSTGGDSHEVSSNTDIHANVIVNSVGGGIHIGSDNYSQQPKNIDVSDNIVISNTGILFNNHAEQSSNSWAGNTAYAEGSATAVEGGSLNSSEVTVLSSEPSINRPNALSESDVGRFAQ